MAEYRIKGSSIRSKLAFLNDTRGDVAEGEARRWLAEQGTRTVLEATWYDYALYDRLLRRIAERHLDGELSKLKTVGRYSARQSLTTTYAAFRQSDFTRFLQKLPALHKRYYSHGRLIASPLPPGASHCEILLEGAPTYSEADLYVAAGFYAGAAELMALRQPRCTFEREGGRVRFRLAWTA